MRTCEHCSSSLIKRTQKRFCSVSCSASFNQVHVRPRKPKKERAHDFSCRSCAKTIPLKTADRRRQFCSHQCQADHRKNITIQTWLGGGFGGNVLVNKTVRRYLIEQAGSVCSLCSWGEINPVTGNSPLHIDHIDGDATNHRIGNLRVLCPNCHSLTPNYGALNMGNGKRRKPSATSSA
jgi:endogenous inhibitor of DNA gyrase (YacG/DUF329 family)